MPIHKHLCCCLSWGLNPGVRGRGACAGVSCLAGAASLLVLRLCCHLLGLGQGAGKGSRPDRAGSLLGLLLGRVAINRQLLQPPLVR